MKQNFFKYFVVGLFCALQTYAQNAPSVSGVFPNLAMVANHSPRTEAGTGGLMP